jgi:hypothetical protein
MLKWKQNAVVKNSYTKLNKRIRQEDPETYMTAIINQVFKKKKDRTKVQIAFVMSICELFLDPRNPSILFDENIAKPRFEKNLVSFKICIIIL